MDERDEPLVEAQRLGLSRSTALLLLTRAERRARFMNLGESVSLHGLLRSEMRSAGRGPFEGPRGCGALWASERSLRAVMLTSDVQAFSAWNTRWTDSTSAVDG